MSQLPASDRRYSEKEVSTLLKRAAELQRSSPGSPNPAGLSLKELEEIAAEAGLDISLLRQAARELDARTVPGAGVTPKLVGGPMKLVLERTLPFEAPDIIFEALVPHIQVAAPSPGQASQIGRTFSWQTQGSSSTLNLQVMVSMRRGETIIRIEENHATFAGALFAGGLAGSSGVAIGVGGTLGGVAGSVLLGVGAPIVLLGGAYFALRSIFASRGRRRIRVLSELMEKIVAEIAHAAETAERG